MGQIVLRHIRQIATPEGKKERKGREMNQLRLIEDGAIWIEEDRIRMVGPEDEVMAALRETDDIEWLDGRGKCAIPGFVDAHTHFLFVGCRAEEFEDRLAGVPYLELLARGGGICRTMQAVREASEEELLSTGKKVLRDMLRFGITTVEGKSGYGLNREDELKQLRVMRRLNQEQPIDIVSTYLGGHAVPPEYQGDGDGYVDFMTEQMLPLPIL